MENYYFIQNQFYIILLNFKLSFRIINQKAKRINILQQNHQKLKKIQKKLICFYKNLIVQKLFQQYLLNIFFKQNQQKIRENTSNQLKKMNDVQDLVIKEIIQQNDYLVEFQEQHSLFESISNIKFDFSKILAKKKVLLNQLLEVLMNTTNLKIFSIIIQSLQIKPLEMLSLCNFLQSKNQMLELELQLEDCNLNFNQIQNLSNSLSGFNQLKKLILDVSESFIQSKGLIYIGKAIQNLPQLLHLTLKVWYCQIELEGFIDFALKLFEVKSLRVLNFDFGWNLYDNTQQQLVKNLLKKQRRLVNCAY
ncbi:hypothetical protein TTHERM_000418079 (macronuclear) [Tetrahymena thermophila SB210]|uniref:Uncharacterized protein n=1 Tax=Tetrahymena thermophila (strain SB210) TaxID=312017 RepID=W7XB22_TETTS|nr:hypothetical protein TTHERM_000418079 [Tetrahymena thermophila SB210]EWS76575.1 hypothetical protein TTHERM_000418079 [Tetrahymena thermophila SB210]|eukprot:XP_012650861.1 hypothetical protein TTHERM_000418079 [Tetrahymena thermophila SB210]